MNIPTNKHELIHRVNSRKVKVMDIVGGGVASGETAALLALAADLRRSSERMRSVPISILACVCVADPLYSGLVDAMKTILVDQNDPETFMRLFKVASEGGSLPANVANELVRIQTR